MLEGAHPQAEEAGLGRAHQAQEGRPADEVEADGEQGRAGAGHGHEAGAVAGLAEHAAVEDLLDEDRDGQLAEGGGDGEDRGQHEALPQLGRDGQPAPEDVDGSRVPEGVLLGGRVEVAALVVVAAGRGGVGEDVDHRLERIVDRLVGELGHAASCS